MRVQWVIAGVVATLQVASLIHAQSAPSVPIVVIVRQVVSNELNDHARHGYWRYWVERHSQSGTRLEEQIETAQGPLTRLAASNGQPLDNEAHAQEQARLRHLLGSPQEQARHLNQYNEDEQRIGRILALLPDAFLYDYDGMDGDTWRFRFRPNPAYPAHSIEARIFHAMSGSLWISSRYTRLVRLEGRVGENVDFGFGILGRLYKGGWFQLVRTQVSPTDWKTAQLEVHMSVRALLVKTFARETSETRSGFAPVPAGLNLAQAMDLLDRSQPAESAARLPALATPATLLLTK